MHTRGSSSRIPTFHEQIGHTRENSEKPLSTNRAKFVNLISTMRKGDEDLIVGSEVLRSLNFALNPQVQQKRRKQKNIRGSIVEQLKSQVIDISKANKDLIKMKRNKAANVTSSIVMMKPKLKQSHSIVGGTCSFLMSEHSSLPVLKKAGNGFTKVTQYDISTKAREKIRVEFVNWLMQNKKEVVQKINESHQLMLSWVVYLNYINRHEFDELLVAIGIPHDANLYDKIFRLFDINDNGVVDQKEVMAALDLFKEHSFEEKVRIFFELADEDGRGSIDEEKLVKFLRKNLSSEEEIKKVKPAVRALVAREMYLPVKGVITMEDLIHACEQIDALKTVIEANVTYSKASNKQPKNKMAAANLIASQLNLGQGGFSLPYMQRLVTAFEEKEKIAEKTNTWNKDYKKAFKYLREVAGMSNDNEQDNF